MASTVLFSDLRRPTALSLSLLLGLVTLGLYLPMLGNGFVDYDDGGYIKDNPEVKAGLSGHSVRWAFHSFEQGNWHPLTWISHMVDCQLFGVNPAGHHLVNALLHTANTVLVFWLLRRMTGRLWPSALVAAFFGWHPLHVESVAWASERKDVLCAFFWLLTMLAYVRYVERPQLGRYVLALLLFACALMAKPMAVTLPCVLLLVDFWPLNRWRPLPHPAAAADGEPVARADGKASVPDFEATRGGRRWAGLILEKLPFFALALADAGVTYLAQKEVGAVTSSLALPFPYRLGNALWSYLRYVSNTVCPAGLALVYPYKAHLPMFLVGVSTALLIVWSGLFLMWWRRFPYLVTGWFWFVGTLVPTIGLIQVGTQSMADRYMYLPSIGLFIVLVWGLAEWVRFQPRWLKPVQGAGALALTACLVLTSIQILYWRDTITLFTHSIEETGDNGVAYFCLGIQYEKAGNKTLALALFSKSVAVEPGYFPAQFSLGKLLLENGHAAEGHQHLDLAEAMAGRNPLLQYNLGTMLMTAGNPAGALPHLAAATRGQPENADFHAALGYALETITNLNGAMGELNRALALQPDNHYARYCLASVLTEAGRTNDALAQYELLVQQDPTDPETHFNLGLARLENGQWAAAQAEFEQELRLAPTEARGHYRLAQAQAGQGQWSKAAAEYREVIHRLPDFAPAKTELMALLAAHPPPK
jgi:tetratricopeptide (TPR) repeat protein